MRQTLVMRLPLLLLVLLAGCPHPRGTTTPVASNPEVTPGADLGGAGAGSAGTDDDLPDPRRGDVTDLDVIHTRVVGVDEHGEPILETTTPGPLLDQGNEAFAAGKLDEAIRLYRQLADEFPDSKLAPAALFNIGLTHEKQGALDKAINAYTEVVDEHRDAPEALDAELQLAAIHADRGHWAKAEAVLEIALRRDDLELVSRIEVDARLGYVRLMQDELDDAQVALDEALASWKRATRVDDQYYVAMAYFYRGEIEHRRFLVAPLRTTDAEMAADMEARRLILLKAYKLWRDALGFKIAYWATASGYHMSEIFFEYWRTVVTAPFPDGMDPQARPAYVRELHAEVKVNLEKALDGHGSNVELAAAYGVDTEWSLASKDRATAISQILDRENRGETVIP